MSLPSYARSRGRCRPCRRRSRNTRSSSPATAWQSRSSPLRSSQEYVPKSILITGGCGFIASHVVLLLARKYPQYKVREEEEKRRSAARGARGRAPVAARAALRRAALRRAAAAAAAAAALCPAHQPCQCRRSTSEGRRVGLGSMRRSRGRAGCLHAQRRRMQLLLVPRRHAAAANRPAAWIAAVPCRRPLMAAPLSLSHTHTQTHTAQSRQPPLPRTTTATNSSSSWTRWTTARRCATSRRRSSSATPSSSRATSSRWTC